MNCPFVLVLWARFIDFLPKLSQTVHNPPLELIYSDLWGPPPMNSHCQFRYYTSFVNAYSRLTWIYFLKNKSDALSVFKQFKSLVELQFNKKIKAIQTDWGGEFRVFSSFLSELGIVHRLTCSHTHHQNGVVERKHHHIVELGLSLLSHASLPHFGIMLFRLLCIS